MRLQKENLQEKLEDRKSELHSIKEQHLERVKALAQDYESKQKNFKKEVLN